MHVSACIEWQLAEDNDALADRVRAAQAAGLNHTDLQLRCDKDTVGLAAALAKNGMTLALDINEAVGNLQRYTQHPRPPCGRPPRRSGQRRADLADGRRVARPG